MREGSHFAGPLRTAKVARSSTWRARVFSRLKRFSRCKSKRQVWPRRQRPAGHLAGRVAGRGSGRPSTSTSPEPSARPAGVEIVRPLYRLLKGQELSTGVAVWGTRAAPRPLGGTMAALARLPNALLAPTAKTVFNPVGPASDSRGTPPSASHRRRTMGVRPRAPTPAPQAASGPR